MKILFNFILGFMLILIVIPDFSECGVIAEEESWLKAALGETFRAAYYALVIGNHNDRSFPRIITAVNNTKEVTRIASKSDQVTEYKNIGDSGYEGGDFISQLTHDVGEDEENATYAGFYGTITATKYATEGEKTRFSVASYIDAWTGIEFVLVKGGCYQMGDTFGDGYGNEKPVHEVCLDDFYIGKFKVTQGQWKTVMGNNPSYFNNCGDDCPVENISWDDTQKFIRILNQLAGKNYRLLTEAEWEYAARSGGKREKWAGTSSESELVDYAWYSGNSGGQTHPVGQKKPNGIGIYDMSGNVWEWVQDIYRSDAYSSHGRSNPIYTGSGAGHVFRGGSWYYNPRGVRAAFRNHRTPVIIIRHHNIGFRLARTP